MATHTWGSADSSEQPLLSESMSRLAPGPASPREENPLKNLKVLYGTGAVKLTEDNEVVRVGGVKYTIKDGVIYDAKALLKEVKDMVASEKKKSNYKILQPGIKE